MLSLEADFSCALMRDVVEVKEKEKAVKEKAIWDVQLPYCDILFLISKIWSYKIWIPIIQSYKIWISKISVTKCLIGPLLDTFKPRSGYS